MESRDAISFHDTKRSTIITTNKPLNRWAETFGDPVLASAMLDRLVHHAHIYSIVGKSYRARGLDMGQNVPAPEADAEGKGTCRD